MSTPHTLGPQHVLIADDEAHITQVLRHSFERAGFEVHTAYDGEQALRIMLTNPIDLVISDLKMPVLDGLEFARTVKSLRTESHVPILLLTGLPLAPSSEELRDIGVNAIIQKPFSPKRVVQTATSLLGGGLAEAA